MSGMIGVDWGSSNLRTFRFDGEGRVVATRASRRGRPRSGRFAPLPAETVDDWSGGDAPIVLAGTVGGRTGRREASYLPCPIAPAELGAALSPIDTPIGRVVIVPGLSARGEDGIVDVLRSEKTRSFGAGLTDRCVILPGTHGRRATIENGHIIGFITR